MRGLKHGIFDCVRYGLVTFSNTTEIDPEVSPEILRCLTSTQRYASKTEISRRALRFKDGASLGVSLDRH
jgi:hypothetical protein